MDRLIDQVRRDQELFAAMSEERRRIALQELAQIGRNLGITFPRNKEAPRERAD